MGSARKTTIYLEPEVHQALRLKAASIECSISEMVDNALRNSLAENAVDLEDYED